jgi:hypothetical protein
MLHNFSTVFDRISSPKTNDLSLAGLEFDNDDDDVEGLPEDEVPTLLELRFGESLSPPSSAINVKAPKNVYPRTRTQTPRLVNAVEGIDE